MNTPHLLAELYEPDTEPLLALEEPETHLHPQAIRTLWDHINLLSGQKIVTSHSPHFVQNVPLRNLRLIRLTKTGLWSGHCQLGSLNHFPT